VGTNVAVVVVAANGEDVVLDEVVGFNCVTGAIIMGDFVGVIVGLTDPCDAKNSNGLENMCRH
jgi:hypothetical protein